MARPLHIEYPGTAYRVTARGNARLQVFEDDADRAALLDLKEITRCEGLIFRPSLIEMFPSAESFGKDERKELIRKAYLDNGYSFTLYGYSKANRVALRYREPDYEGKVMGFVVMQDLTPFIPNGACLYSTRFPSATRREKDGPSLVLCPALVQEPIIFIYSS